MHDQSLSSSLGQGGCLTTTGSLRHSGCLSELGSLGHVGCLSKTGLSLSIIILVLYQLDGLAAFIAVEDVDLDPPVGQLLLEFLPRWSGLIAILLTEIELQIVDQRSDDLADYGQGLWPMQFSCALKIASRAGVA